MYPNKPYDCTKGYDAFILTSSWNLIFLRSRFNIRIYDALTHQPLGYIAKAGDDIQARLTVDVSEAACCHPVTPTTPFALRVQPETDNNSDDQVISIGIPKADVYPLHTGWVTFYPFDEYAPHGEPSLRM